MAFYDDEIDIRPYLRKIIRFSWLILLIAVVVAGIAYLYSKKQPVTYESTAIMLLTRSRPTLSLAQQFPTVSDPVDANARLSAILTIAQSDAVAQSAAQEWNKKGNHVPADGASLKGSVVVTNKGDAVLITARADEPGKAIQLANIWADQTDKIVNQAYSRDQPLSDIESQIGEAEKQYRNAQATLESFIESDQIDILGQRIDESKSLLKTLDGNRTALIDFYSNRAKTMQETAAEAEALKKQLESGDSSTAGQIGDALAVLIARSVALGINTSVTNNNNNVTNTENPNLTFQITDPKALIDGKEKYAADLDIIIQQAKAEQVNAETGLENLALTIAKGQSTQVSQESAAHLSDLEKQLESQQTQLKELTGKRDTALTAYQTILQKEAELINGPQVSNEVNIASQAVNSIVSTRNSPIKTALLGGLIGLLVGVAGVVGTEWLRSANIFSDEGQPYSSDSAQERAQP